MCGIAGVLAPPRGIVDAHEVAQLDAAIAHRGPDGRGVLSLTHDDRWHLGASARDVPAGRLALVHRRLAVLDPSAAGQQPMVHATAGLAVTYNGELYNFRALRDELARAGERFVTGTDTEVLLAAYAQWGVAAFARFEGMFAFALLDLRQRVLHLVRDRRGIKPLLIARVGTGDGARVAFASELRALLPLASGWRLAPQAAYDYLRNGLTGHTTASMVQGIWHLPPGTVLSLSLDDDHPATQLDESLARAVRFDDAMPNARRGAAPSIATRDEAVALLRTRLLASVDAHLQSDVPVGAALSGGIDSSSIVACAFAARDGDASGGQRAILQRAFTFASGDDSDESAWAARAAAPFPLPLQHVTVRDTDLADDFDDVVTALDEPAGSTSVYAQYRVYRAAREAGIPVLLDGQGADELLAGYHSAHAVLAAEYWRTGKLRDAWRLLRTPPRVVGASAGPWKAALARILPVPLVAVGRVLARRTLVPVWLERTWLERHGVRPTDLMGYRTLREQLDGDLTLGLRTLLSYQDRNSMRFGVESRVPFLDSRLVQLCRSIPAPWLFGSEGRPKALLRDAMRGLVPDVVLDRRDKVAFRTPQQAWLRAGHARFAPLLDSEPLRALGLFARSAPLRPLWDAAVLGHRRYVDVCWRWINFARWLEQTGVSPP